jgi:hypothetical protein
MGEVPHKAGQEYGGWRAAWGLVLTSSGGNAGQAEKRPRTPTKDVAPSHSSTVSDASSTPGSAGMRL